MEVVKFSESGGSEILNLCPAINAKKGKDLLRKASALIRFHFKINPENLSDAEFSELWQELRFALDFESRRYDSNTKTLEL